MPFVTVFLVLACVPSFSLNAGPGRGVMLHQHADETFHAHVVAASRHEDHLHWHAHDHVHVGGSSPDAHHGPDEPEDDDQCTVVAGTEVGAQKRQREAAEVSSVRLDCVPTLFAVAARPLPAAPVAASTGPPTGRLPQDLDRVRTVILLI